MKRNKIDLRTLLVVLSIMAILSFTVGGYLYYSSLSKFSKVRAYKESAEHLKDLGNNIDAFLNWSLLSVKSIAGLKEIKQSLLNIDEVTLADTNALLEQLRHDLNVSVCYLMDYSGNTIASSNHGEPNSFVGKNYGFRPYFKQAIQGKPSIYMALGITSMERGVYYSHPVFGKDEKKPLGVAVIKASIEIIERDFLKPFQGIVMLTDPHGLVFVANRPDWLYHLLWPASPEIVEEIKKQSQFGKGPWNWIGVKLINQDHAIDSQGNEYRVHKQGLANYPDWHLVYLHSDDEIMETVIWPLRKSVGVIVISLCIFFGFIVIFLFLKANTEIIQRKAAEKELRENEALLEATGFVARVGGWQLDVETMAVTWTKETYNIHEVPLNYKPPLDKAIEFFHPDDRGALSQAIQRALDLGEPYDMDLRFITAKGNNLWTRSICQPEIVDGKTVRLRGTFQDITLRKRADEELRRKERDLKESQRIAHVGSWRLDMATNQVVWTEELYNMYGFDPSLPPPPYTEHMKLFTPESWERLSTALAHTRETGIPYTLELEIVRKDGSNGWMWVQGEAEVDSAGKTVELWGAAQDITERKQAEEALRDSEQMYRITFDAIPDSITVTRQKDGRYNYVNDGFCYITGYSRDEVIGKTPVDINLYVNHSDREKMIQTLRQSQVLLNFEIPFRKKNGTIFDSFFSAKPIVIDGEDCLIALTKDVTEFKRAKEEKAKLETQLLQAQKMESVGRLAGGVAHDFNNMLGVILGHVEFALEKAEENHDLYNDLNEIQKAAQRSANLTKQLLTFARKDIISPKQIDLNDTVESMLNMLRRLIGEDIDLVWQPGAHLWPVKMDPSQIDQILANLCVNARDAIADVGKLTIETGRHTFDVEYCNEHPGFIPGDFVLLAVSDNGSGMDKDTLDNLFEPFFTTKDIGKGTGLGLATVYGIVKQNNGFINVYSEPGQGTTFRIYLPRCSAGDETLGVIQLEKPVPTGNETILLVEDEPAILKLTRMMLERKGYSVLSAASPADAIDMAKAHTDKIHLLMTDVVMPGMNGRDLAEKLSALYPDIKVLFMSGYTANVIAHQGVLDNGVAFIQKPFSIKDLAASVRKVLTKKK